MIQPTLIKSQYCCIVLVDNINDCEKMFLKKVPKADKEVKNLKEIYPSLMKNCNDFCLD